ncbi:GGDEF domain-containing protein [Capsulimonas corticalis]|uniref:GGDEF domain-containing protein n=1 Tax=Capsulimonas corticalis TaxID=2219043 RepID=A0A402D2V4_9BACT|nr:EAL domain-containing protein [Capsulimonas corticalis]BDI28399.1 GGDEF domain-containing protein [Capsulimonas corticalis]
MPTINDSFDRLKHTLRDTEDRYQHIVKQVTEVVRQLKETLRDLEERYQHIAEQATDVIFQLDSQGRWVFLNSAWTRLTGYGVDESLGRSFLEVVEESDRASSFEIFTRALRGQKCEGRELNIRTKDGDPRTVEVRARLMEGAEGWALVGVLCDATGRRRAEEALTLEHAFLRDIIDTDPNAIFVTDEHDAFCLVNRAASALCGADADTFIGQRACDLDPSGDYGVLSHLDAAAPGRASGVFDARIIDQSGRVRWLQTVKKPIYSALTGRHYTLGIATDITDRKRLEHELAHQALHDTLTSLPNRVLFMDRVNRALANMRRTSRPNAVIMLDVDNFKVVNDAMGHGAGDRLLIAITERLLTCVRPGDTVARFGGDEFTVLLEDLNHSTDALFVAERILESFKHPLCISGRDVTPTVSMGVAIGHSENELSEELIRNADTAMYQAKTAGKAGFALFDPSMNAQAVERLELEGDLRKAISNGELTLDYQPIVRARNGEITEFEALARWSHPRLGLVPPTKFIPIAEETGLIIPLGLWVLREACAERRRWIADAGANPDLMIAVNVSLTQLRQPNFVSQISAILHETGTEPRHVKIEITETVMMFDAEAMIEKFAALKHLGVRLAIDDFGTGYSSIAYLLRLPVNTVKIDRFFISQIGRQREDEVVIRSIVGMARSLGMEVTCEGVETEAQLAMLRKLDVDFVQGYLIAKPLPPTAVAQTLRQGVPVTP